MSPSSLACVVLASGLSDRFGQADKLTADLCGRSVLSHVLETARSVEFGEIFVVSRQAGAAGFSWVENKNPDWGQGHALRLGLSAVRQKGWDVSAVLLGDMPLVPLFHVIKMVKKSDRKQSFISVCESVRLPPAVFCAADIDFILSENSEAGARTLFSRLHLETVLLDAEAALDVDTPKDLARMTRIMEARKT